MTEKERSERIAQLRAELKELQATPRSDWHAAFEALLRIETYKYGNKVRILTEEVLGEEAPRADYVVLIENEEVRFDKEIFRKFRKHNILEYKNPEDSLNERVLRKICGYANLYIGVAEHEGDVPSDQVTISIFRAGKNPELFDRMRKEGTLIADDTPGIYQVVGYTDLPFQIVITSELKGDEYAAYRTLTNRAEQGDVGRVLNAGGHEGNSDIRNHYRILVKLVVEKNPELAEIIRRNSEMKDVLMEIVSDRVDERVSTAEAAKEQETLVSSIRNLMTTLKLSLEQAMDALCIPQSQRATYAGLVGKP